jgi:hypothetical protein
MGPAEEEAPSTRLKMFLTRLLDFDKTGFCNSLAEALIQRIPVLGVDHEWSDPNRAFTPR